MPRVFKAIGNRNRFTFIPQRVRELVTRNGRDSVEYRERESISITKTPTVVPDEVAEDLVKSKHHGVYFVEVTGAKETAQKAANELEKKGKAPSKKKEPPPPNEEDDLKEAPGVKTTADAVAFLTERGAQAEDLQDKAGRAHSAKITSVAKDLGFTFPNYGK